MHWCRNSISRNVQELPGPLLCSISRVSQETGLSRFIVEQLIASGQLAVVSVGRRKLVPRLAVEELKLGHLAIAGESASSLNSTGRAA